MGGPKYIATMDEWMLDVLRRVEKLERRKHHKAYVRAAEGQPLTASERRPLGAGSGVEPSMWALPVGTTLRDNGDGTFTVVPSPPLTEYDEL